MTNLINNYNIEPKANLSWANLSCADLSDANLKYANLKYANLKCANLTGADLSCANLTGADLSCANLKYANLSWANLSCANLSDANLNGADLTNIKVNYLTKGYFSTPPNEGAYTAYKKCKGYIVKLLIPEDALRSSATTRKCRSSKAKVLEFVNCPHVKYVASNYDSTFLYELNKTVEVNDFDTNRWNECSTGIHHFLTYEEALAWQRSSIIFRRMNQP